MRIHVTSDLHADFTGNAIDFPAVDCDIHLIVGDGAAPARHALEIIDKALLGSTALRAYVVGNHDFYHTAAYPQSFYQDELAQARELGKSLGIPVLHNDVFIVGDCRILGTPLFTNMRVGTDTMSVKQKMSQSQKGWFGDERRDGGGRGDYHEDFRQIRFDGPGTKNRFTPSQWLQLHSEAMDFLLTELAFDHIGETVVATHMAPHPNSLMGGADGPHHMHDWLYATNDVDFFDRVDCWLHGHIHASRDYEIDGCRIVANPRGYPNKGGSFENPNWDPALVIDVERRYAPTFGR